MNIKEIISKMTLEDKISLCTGEDFWHTKMLLCKIFKMKNNTRR